MLLWSSILSSWFLLQKHSINRMSSTCQTDAYHTICRELPAKSMGLYHFNLLLGTWNTLKTQTGTVASHQILNQIQFKEKGFGVFPVSRLVGIPFTSFAQDCTRERFNTGDASLKEGTEVFYCISHTSFSSKTDDCCRQGLRDTVLRQKYKSASRVFTRGAAVRPSLKSN